MFLRPHRIHLVTAVAVVFALVGSVGSTATAVQGQAKAQRGGALTILIANDIFAPGSIDPIRLRSVSSYGSLQSDALYDTLFLTDPETLDLVPRIGLSMKSTDGGRTWVLKLREKVVFSDGTPFDAEAVRFNWARIQDPANAAGSAATATLIQTMEVVDPLTLRVTLKSPDPSFQLRVSDGLAWIGSPSAIKSMGATAFGAKPVGAGPFVLKEWIRSTQYNFVRNPTYWEKGKPYLDEYIIKIVGDDSQRYNTLRTGGGNAMSAFSPQALTTAEQDGFKLIPTSANGGGWSVSMNNAKPPFNDPRVRKIVDLAIDRKQFIQTRRIGDMSLNMTTLDIEGTPFYDPNIKVPKTDLVAAQKLVDQVVAETGKPIQFSLMHTTTAFVVDDAATIQAQLTKLKNFEMKLDPVASGETVRRSLAGDFQAFLNITRWNAPSIDMEFYLSSASSNNVSRYNSPVVDNALRQLVTEQNQPTREQLVRTIERQVLKDSPVAWVARTATYQVIHKSVRDYVAYFDIKPVLSDVWVSTKKS